MGNQLDCFCFQALVSLNNTGAILIQRNRFEEAYLTFMDALHVLEHGRSLITDDDRAAFRSSLYAMVACATMRFGSTNQQPPANVLGHGLASTIQGPVGGGLCTEQGRTADLRVLNQESIYLNHQCLHACDVHIDLAAAVVVYNFAVCHLKMAIFNPSEQDYFQTSGISLMKYAYAVLPPIPPFTAVDDFSSIATMSVITLSLLVEMGTLNDEESCCFREQLRLAQEGLSIFAAQPRTAPAA